VTRERVPCPYCDHLISKVTNTRGPRRRRECLSCGKRFTTRETAEKKQRRSSISKRTA